MGTATADRWDSALRQFEDGMRRAGYAPGNISQRVKHMARFAAGQRVGPWDISPLDVAAWLDGIQGSPATRQGYKTSVRCFYRWAYRTGHVFDDPTETPDARRRRKPIADEWAAELTAFRGYLRASGKPETTVGIRISHLRRFARETYVKDPWEATLDDLVEWLAGKHWALETRRAHRSSLRSFYAWGARTGRIAEDPAVGFPVVKTAQPRPRPVADDAFEESLRKADAREELMLRLSAELGLRAGEVCQVHTSDVVGPVDARSLVVHGKGDRERTVPLSPGLAALIASHPAGHVFPGNIRGHLSSHHVSKLVSALLPRGVTMHALRHRFASKAYDVDRDVFTVQKLLGHASPATTQRYVEVTDTAARRLVLAVAR